MVLNFKVAANLAFYTGSSGNLNRLILYRFCFVSLLIGVFAGCKPAMRLTEHVSNGVK
jgi:hypothetical protein